MNENTLTKQQAIDALNNGEKISHEYFTAGEFIYLRNGQLTDEAGIELAGTIQHFFDTRPWNDGWKIYN